MEVVLARHAGACYGVQRALDLAVAVIDEGREVRTLGPLIHNPKVVAISNGAARASPPRWRTSTAARSSSAATA